MKSSKIHLISTLFLIFCFVFGAAAQKPTIKLDRQHLTLKERVTSLKAEASPKRIENCQGETKTIKTSVRVTVNAPCTVQYTWLRSDGATDTNGPHTLTFDKAGTKTVSTEWFISRKEYIGWQALQIIAPNKMTSNKALFKIYCDQQSQNCEEDCLGFNPNNLSINTDIAGMFRVVDGNHSMFGLNSQADAQKAISIIKHYQMNEICFVGRPGEVGENVIMYFKTNGKAPVGGMAGEDCLSFNPSTVEAKLVNGTWKVVDGNHWMFDFGSDAKAKDSAHQTVCIIKKYGFTKTCFVGRPFSNGNGMIYFRK
jgi:hypothetical protein